MVMEYLRPKKTLDELQDEKERQDLELSLEQQRVLRKQLEAKGASLDAFKNEHGQTMWSRVINWLKNH